MMFLCPYCESENIEGVDVCERCGQPLDFLHLQVPATAVERGLLRDRVTVLQPKPPVTVSSRTSVGEVLQMLMERSIGCVLVVDDEQIVGIFSERDAVLKLGAEAADRAHLPVSEFMTDSPECLDTSAKLAFAVQRMDLGGYRHVPIVDEQRRPIGIISVRDILRYLTEKMTRAAEDGASEDGASERVG